MLKGKRSRKFLLISATLLSSFAASGESLFDGIAYDIGPLVAGSPLTIRFRYTNMDLPRYEYSWTLYQDSSKAKTLYSQLTKSGVLSSSNPEFYDESSVPAYYTKVYSSVFLVINFNIKASIFTQTYPLTATWNIERFGDQMVLEDPQENKVYDTYRWCNRFSNGNQLKESDLYRIGSWGKDNGQKQYHGLNISSFTIGFHGGINNSNVLSGKSDLYIFSYPDEWTVFPKVFLNGKYAAKVPLVFEYLSNWTSDQGVLFRIYKVQTEFSYYVSRLDYSMYSSTPPINDYFRSNDVFIPTKKGHDDAIYQCQLNLYDLTEYRDRITVNFMANNTGKFFGNCVEADYCVALG